MRHSSFDPDVNGQAWTEEMGVRTARSRGTAIAEDVLPTVCVAPFSDRVLETSGNPGARERNA